MKLTSKYRTVPYVAKCIPRSLNIFDTLVLQRNLSDDYNDKDKWHPNISTGYWSTIGIIITVLPHDFRGVSNHRQVGSLLKSFVTLTMKKTKGSALVARCNGNTPVTGWFPHNGQYCDKWFHVMMNRLYSQWNARYLCGVGSKFSFVINTGEGQPASSRIFMGWISQISHLSCKT